MVPPRLLNGCLEGGIMRGSSTGVVGGVASVLSLSLAIAGAAQAQSTPKELFIGLDGDVDG